MMRSAMRPGVAGVSFLAMACLVPSLGRAEKAQPTPKTHLDLTSSCPEIVRADIRSVFNLSAKIKNHLIFNHEKGIIDWPVPAQLEAADGDVFAIIFACSDASKFDYKIEGIKSAGVPGSTFTIDTEAVKEHEQDFVSLTWRHDRLFPLYKVTVLKRKAAKKETPEDEDEARVDLPRGAAEMRPLHSYSFPMWDLVSEVHSLSVCFSVPLVRLKRG